MALRGDENAVALWLPAKDLFSTNWMDKDSVIKLAKKLGKGMSVIKYANRSNFNVTHTSTLDRCKRHGEFTIIHQT